MLCTFENTFLFYSGFGLGLGLEDCGLGLVNGGFRQTRTWLCRDLMQV